jgi:pyrroline-5-carboxylate reductase
MSYVIEKIGIAGCGAMGGSILSALQRYQNFDLRGYDPEPVIREFFVNRGIHMENDVRTLASVSDLLILAVKTTVIPDVLAELRGHLKNEAIVVSIAPGVTMAELRKGLGTKNPVAHVMPNTPAMVGAGTFGLCMDDPCMSPEQKKCLQQIFGLLGSTVVIPEEKVNAFTAIVGCGPAYVFYFMDALKEAAVTLGFGRTEAQVMVNSMVSGSAKLAASEYGSFSMLREQVCSPGGLTIEAMNHLDRTAVRGHIIDSVIKAWAKGRMD